MGMCFILYLAVDMGLHYLTFMGRNLENRKKLMPVQLMNCMNIVNIINIFSDNVTMNSIFG